MPETVKSRDLHRALAASGFAFVRQGGRRSHEIWRAPNGELCVFPLGHAQVAEALARTEVRRGGVSWDDFRQYLTVSDSI
jgi:predicted RNA binding protein YcfA (HicA-like mRNA interferase family)